MIMEYTSMKPKNCSQKRAQRGFTLIEVMIVVIILGILASFILPRIMDRPDAARTGQRAGSLQAR